MLSRFTAGASGHIFTASTLTRLYVAMVVQRTARITITQLTAVLTVGQTKCFWHALIAILSGDQTFAFAFSVIHVAAKIADRSKNVAAARLTSFGIVLVQIPKTISACVTSTSSNVSLAVTSARFDSTCFIGQRVTDSIIERTAWITIAC